MKDLWVSVSGAVAQQRNVETIANNVANINTPGFKRDQLTFKEHLTAIEKGITDVDLPSKEWTPEDFYRSYGAEDAHVKVDGSFTIHDQGQLTPTGNPFDVAINGSGFFEVLAPNGIRYTRRGTFTIAKDGTLMTEQGFPVLSRYNWNDVGPKGGPSPAALPAPADRKINVGQGGKVTINLEGEVYAGNARVSDLSVIEFKDTHALKKEGNSLFVNNDLENIKTTTVKSTTHQGFVEESNVNAVSEMSDLIKANRQFETIQRAIKAYDNITGKAVNEIAKF